MDQVDESGLNPSLLASFPVEIWEKVLWKCGDSRDVQNVLTAFPGMEGVVLKNKCEWALDQVLPHIRPWLTNDDILSCRRVCVRWSRAVDNYLENHPSRRAFDHDERQVTDPFHPQKLWDNGDLYLKLTKRFNSFHQNMKRVPQSRNPFLGRLTEVDYGDGATKDEIRNRKRTPVEPWTRELEALKKFGGQIWYLWIYSDRPEKFHYYQRFLSSLELLPNLKSVNFDISWDGLLPLVVFDKGHVEIGKYLKEKRASLPALPQLESLAFSSFTQVHLVNMMVLKYSPQIRRLEIHFHFWKREYSNLFPKLTELSIKGLRSHQDSFQILQPLQAPDLFRLELEVAYNSKYLGNWILYLLGNRFQRLGSLCIALVMQWTPVFCGQRALSISQVGPALPVTPFPSVKSLLITGYLPEEMDFTFLESLPSLEQIKIRSQSELPYFQDTRMYELGLWGTLPKLKVISVDIWTYEKRVRLGGSRDHYDWRRRKVPVAVAASNCSIV